METPPVPFGRKVLIIAGKRVLQCRCDSATLNPIIGTTRPALPHHRHRLVLPAMPAAGAKP